jgi:hypothetical protein
MTKQENLNITKAIKEGILKHSTDSGQKLNEEIRRMKIMHSVYYVLFVR